eukprot:1012780-Prorocentrum_minimum.AAC.3
MSDFPFFGARMRNAPKTNNLIVPDHVYEKLRKEQEKQELRRRLNPGVRFERNHTKKASPNVFHTPTGSPEPDYSDAMAALQLQSNPVYEPSTNALRFKPFSMNFAAKPKTQAKKAAKPKHTAKNKPFTAFTVAHKNRTCAKDAVDHAVNCMALTKPEIQDILRARGLKVTGTKAELCVRLLALFGQRTDVRSDIKLPQTTEPRQLSDHLVVERSRRALKSNALKSCQRPEGGEHEVHVMAGGQGDHTQTRQVEQPAVDI